MSMSLSKEQISPQRIDAIADLLSYQDKVKPFCVSKNQFLLHEGCVSDAIYVINQGAARISHNDGGRDITLQFFFEQQLVASFESFYWQCPSRFAIETIEPCELIKISRESFMLWKEASLYATNFLIDWLSHRFTNYSELFLSRIKNSPQQRYLELMKKQPELFKRVPHHHIASYLGIT
ncbi:MAG: Crp/Fnr family transcriptional regulator [Cardiobacteriaceae bacterium]|nr:Crp/Fnr family transcriptional regulator [Cardiobacteriaceae bacterium]